MEREAKQVCHAEMKIDTIFSPSHIESWKRIPPVLGLAVWTRLVPLHPGRLDR